MTDQPKNSAVSGVGSSDVLERGREVVWHKTRRWGGTQSEPAVFLEYRGKESALILHGCIERTVLLRKITAL